MSRVNLTESEVKETSIPNIFTCFKTSKQSDQSNFFTKKPNVLGLSAIVGSLPVLYGIFNDMIMEGIFGPPVVSTKIDSKIQTLEKNSPNNSTKQTTAQFVISRFIPPNFKKLDVYPTEYNFNIRNHSVTLFKVKDSGPVFQTKDGGTQFYLPGDQNWNPNNGFNIATELNKTVKLEFNPGCFIIPSPSANIKSLLETDYLNKNGLKFLGIIGSSYVSSSICNNNIKRGNAIGYAYLKKDGVLYDTLKNDSGIRDGYVVENGRVRYFTLPSQGYEETLRKLKGNPQVTAISVCSHTKESEKNSSFYNNRYRAPFIVFDNKGGLLGVVYTSESKNNSSRKREILKAFSTASYWLKLDGDFFSKRYLIGNSITNFEDKNPLAFGMLNAHLVVCKGKDDFSKNEFLLADARIGEVLSKDQRIQNLIQDSENPQKIASKIKSKIPKFILGRELLVDRLSKYAASNKYIQGYMIRIAMGEDTRRPFIWPFVILGVLGAKLFQIREKNFK